MGYDLKEKVVRGVSWTALGKLSTEVVQFVLSVIIARLVTPNDYGILGLILVFINISQVFIDSGFGRALIYKNNLDERDLQTVFTFNAVVSIIIFFIIVFSSNIIEDFFQLENLSLYLKTASIVLLINSFLIVPTSIHQIKLNFKSISGATFGSTIVGGIVGIIMAVKGLGVWALIFQLLVRNFTNFIILIFSCKWIPKFKFYKDSFVESFKFSFYLVVSSLTTKTTEEGVSFIVGKVLSPYNLGLYSRGKQFAALPNGIFGGILSVVIFPVLSSLKNDKEKFYLLYKKAIQMQSFITIPILVMLIMIAKPLVLILLTDKWIQIVPILQIFCVGSLFAPMAIVSEQVLVSIGKSKLSLKQQVLKMITKAIFVFSMLPWGLIPMIIGEATASILAFFITNFFTNKHVKYSAFNQLLDISWTLFISIVSFGIGYIPIITIKNNYMQIFFSLLLFSFVYIGGHYVFQKSLLFSIIAMIKKK